MSIHKDGFVLYKFGCYIIVSSCIYLHFQFFKTNIVYLIKYMQRFFLKKKYPRAF